MSGIRRILREALASKRRADKNWAFGSLSYCYREVSGYFPAAFQAQTALAYKSVRLFLTGQCRAALEKESRFREEQQLDQTVLFPIKLDEAIKEATSQWVCKIRRERHIGDFTRWKDHDEYQQAFKRLLRDLKAGA